VTDTGPPNLVIRSGGQTGVDRAALDAAMESGLECGGWCPQGRRAEDGSIDIHYPLRETPDRDYGQRSEWNVRDSDATLILCFGARLAGGTAVTQKVAMRLMKPLRVVDPELVDPARGDTESICRWLADNGIATLNVAGPRESQQPGIYRASKAFLLRLFADLL